MIEEPSLDELIAEHERRQSRVDEGGGRARQERQRRLGRMNARERVAALVDAGSFVEIGRHVVHRHAHASEQLAANLHPGDGLVCGLATIDGASVAVYAHDPTVLRGAVGITGARKLCKLLDLAGERGLPILALADSDGVRVDEGTDAIEAYGEILRRTIALKGKVVQLTLVCGLCVGAAAYTATLTDLVAMVDGQGFMFITGPKVARIVMGEEVDIADLGGSTLHATKTGACHAVVKDDLEGIAWMKRVLAALRPNVTTDDPIARSTTEIGALVPTSARRAYDMRKVIGSVFDRGSVVELSPKFAASLITSLARLDGQAVAIVASQPMVRAGTLDVDASRKGASFVTWANQRGLPIVTFVDVPGYLPGRRQEEAGIVPIGATLLTAYGTATVPLISLVVRKSFGGASVLSFAAQVRLALPTARIAPMGADAAVEVAIGPLSPDATDDERAGRQALRARWLAQNDHAWAPAEAGYIDQVIVPADVRRTLGATLARLTPLSAPARL